MQRFTHLDFWIFQEMCSLWRVINALHWFQKPKFPPSLWKILLTAKLWRFNIGQPVAIPHPWHALKQHYQWWIMCPTNRSSKENIVSLFTEQGKKRCRYYVFKLRILCPCSKYGLAQLYQINQKIWISFIW